MAARPAHRHPPALFLNRFCTADVGPAAGSAHRAVGPAAGSAARAVGPAFGPAVGPLIRCCMTFGPAAGSAPRDQVKDPEAVV